LVRIRIATKAVSSPGGVIGKENDFLGADGLLMPLILPRKNSGNRGAAAGAGAYGETRAQEIALLA
jgi:hypothetical protein